MQPTLAGKTALITGAARRIGATIAAALHAQGANVAIHYRNSAHDANALAETCNAARPDSARTFCADLLDVQALAPLVQNVLRWQGQLDMLINNASTFHPTPLGSITERHWHDLVGSNLQAPLFLCQSAAPALRETGGSIVNIIDIHARRPLRHHAIYTAAKAGLAMLTCSLAKELAPEVRVNGVAPGAILWPEGDISDADKSSIVAQIPLKRTGHPNDIARCIMYLARDATYVTGQIIAVDGGRSIGW